MVMRFWLSLSLTALMAGSAAAQDVRSVLQTAATAMGVDNMESIHYSGTGWQGMVGQNAAPDQNWPRVDLTSYSMTIDFETMSSREEYVPGTRRQSAPRWRPWVPVPDRTAGHQSRQRQLRLDLERAGTTRSAACRR